ncbi:MAG: hypothetical protein COB12_10950 [Flavobacterium sp.]|nr:MAG: hypothetical protein COB12_10950 [Flavobacterium sp.]
MNKKIKIKRVIGICIFLLGLTLPLKDQFSTISILLILVISLFVYYNYSKNNKKTKFVFLLIPFALIFIRLLGYVNGEIEIATKELVRAIPFLLVPISFIFLNEKNVRINIEKRFYYGLLIGVFMIMIICEYHVFNEIIINSQSLGYLFRWRYLNFNFTNPVGIHPAYLGILIVWLITITLYSNYISKRFRIFIVLFLFVLLFQLVSRSALLLSVALVSVFILKQHNRLLKFIFFGFITAFVFVIITHPSDYLRSKFFNEQDGGIVFSEKNRFTRLEASLKVFKMAPILGIGPGIDDKLRIQEYKKADDDVAYKNKYNSHNQFIEYLSTFGLVGLTIFLIVLVILLNMLFKIKDKVYFFLLIAFIFACITESVLERTLGIKYFSILISLIIIKYINETNSSNILNGSRS